MAESLSPLSNPTHVHHLAGQSRGLAVVLAEKDYECLELHYPRLRLVEAGYTVQVAGPTSNHTYTSKEGYWAHSTHEFKAINPKDVKVLIVPGGFAPDRLRRYADCLNLVSEVCKNGGVIGFICHGAWVPISAKIVKGKKATCYFAIKDDLINAGADYSEAKVVVDGNLVSAQTPEDLPGFMSAILKLADK